MAYRHTQLDYQKESARPLVSLLFLAPMLIAYETGMLLLGPGTMRNGADVWLRHSLEWLGFGQYFLLPILTCTILLAWHHMSRESWRVHLGTMPRMLFESIALAVLLLVVAHLQGRIAAEWSLQILPSNPTPEPKVPPSFSRAWSRLIPYFGAGIYEELLFRLMLLSSVIGLTKWIGASRKQSLIFAVSVSSFLFAASHYEIFVTYGDAFQWYSFLFRFLAGIFFSALFVWRGFGITATTHAFYDILVVVL
ncbi:MAG TPA: CPBP family intramembrane metalloprotease [Planctomycetes bacterium]|nr:CPBP family intramembrane metalloprotease [Planctomycetaceae bacterium]HIN94884.1 CPBP family intramembrane metalloprotease [Planctomycetota bacterium]